MMRNRILFNLAGLLLILVSVFFFFDTRGLSTVKAAQCWDPGCCGWTLKYNQWSCQTNNTRCYDWETGEIPQWFCSTTNQSYGTQPQCQSSCTGGTCEYACSNGFSKECVITQGDVNCSHPNDSTCTANVYAVQCTSLAGGDDCSTSVEPLDVRQCWVTGSPPQPTPPPVGGGSCDGNWWGCGAGSCTGPHATQSACETATGGSCSCGSCPAACSSTTGRRAIFLYEDTNENGVWDHAAGERRISTTNSCVASNAQYVAGAQILVDGQVRNESCNVGNSEYTGATCTWSLPAGGGFCPAPGGPGSGSNCQAWGPESLQVEGTCFSSYNCHSGCHWSGSCDTTTATANGAVCAGGNCGGTGDLKAGSSLIMPRDTGNHTVGAVVPAGWRISNGMPSNPVTVNWGRTNGSCEGAVGIGLARDTNTSCYVSPSSSVIPGGTGSVNVRLWGSTDSSTTHTVRLWLQTKNPTTTAPTALAMNPIPAGTTQFINSGRYSYQYQGSACTTANGTSCSTERTITGLPQGAYYFHCDVVEGTAAPFLPECSGNPSCLYEGLGGLVDCATNGWRSCMPSTATPTDNAPLTASCVPSCTPSCGGPDGCGGTCASTDLGLPSVVQNLAPSGNYTVVGSTVPISWTAPVTNAASIDSYDIRVFSNTVPIGSVTQAYINARTCNTPGGATCASVTNTVTSWNYTPEVVRTRDIYVAVRANNYSCGPQSGPWAITSLSLFSDISGNFYIDNGSASAPPGGFCSNGGTQAATVQTGTTINATVNTNPVGSSSISGSTYSVTSVPYNPSVAWGPLGILTLDLENPDAANTLACSCPTPGSDPFICTYGGVYSPITGLNWYLDLYDLSNDPWWQTRGGLAYADGTMSTNIPSTCRDEGDRTICDPYLITREIVPVAAPQTGAGVPMTSGGAVNTGSDLPGYYTDRAPQPRAVGTDHSGIVREDYAYFSSFYNLSQVTPLNSAVVINKTDLPVAVNPDPDGTEVFYRSGDLTIAPTQIWVLTPGEKKVIFVDGNITFQGPGNVSDRLIRVDNAAGNTGFIAFIASGNITFDQNVGYNVITQESPTNIAGLFVADGQIIIEESSDVNISDRKFLGAGTFVGWSGFDMQRDFANDADPLSKALNNLDPTESFEFLPELVVNFPDKMKSPVIEWQEVN